MRSTLIMRPPTAQVRPNLLSLVEVGAQYGALDAAIQLPEWMTDEAIALVIDPDTAYIEIMWAPGECVRAYHPDTVELWTDTREWLVVLVSRDGDADGFTSTIRVADDAPIADVVANVAYFLPQTAPQD